MIWMLIMYFQISAVSIGKKQFDETQLSEEVLTGEDDFRVNYFLVVVDMAITSVKDMYDQMMKLKVFLGYYLI